MLIPVHVSIYIHGSLRYSCVCSACLWVSISPWNVLLAGVHYLLSMTAWQFLQLTMDPEYAGATLLGELVGKHPNQEEKMS